MKLTIRIMLLSLAAVSLVAMLLLGGMAMLTAQRGAQHLEVLRGEVIAPLRMLSAVDSRIKETRFRIAGVALGMLPTVGSSNHLKETRASLPADWEGFLAVAGETALSEEGRAHFDALTQGMAALPAFFDKVEAAYQDSDLDTVKYLLEDDWLSFPRNFVFQG